MMLVPMIQVLLCRMSPNSLLHLFVLNAAVSLLENKLVSVVEVLDGPSMSANTSEMLLANYQRAGEIGKEKPRDGPRPQKRELH